MIGLAAHARDALLPTSIGDPAAPSTELLLEAIQRCMVDDGAPRAVSARWVFARWKPGQALACGYEVLFSDGVTRWINAKWRAGFKPLAVRDQQRVDGLRALVFDAQLGFTLALFPFDPELPGLARVLDLRRLARWFSALGLGAPLKVRPGPSRVEVLRYKPERRAVARLALKLREHDDAPRVARTWFARVHPPQWSRRAAELRTQFDARVAPSLCPRLCASDARTGVWIEEALEVVACGADDFAHAFEAGATLARLHATELADAEVPAADALDFSEWRTCAPWVAQALCAPPIPGPRVWRHGDFHPDQLAQASDGSWRLLDLDALTLGDARADLASWIADAVAAAPQRAWREHALALLEGYGSLRGAAPRVDELAPWVALALQRLACGALRRLESGALERSRSLAELAASVASQPAHVSPLVGLEVERIDPVRGTREARLETLVAPDPRARVQRCWRIVSGNHAQPLLPAADAELALARRFAAADECDLLAYRPGRRITLRRRAASGATILKGYRRGRTERAAAGARVAMRLFADGVPVRAPRLLAVRAEHDALELEDLGGAPLELARWDEARARAIGGALRRFQDAHEASSFEVHDHAAELAVLDDLRATVERLARVPRDWERWRTALESVARDLGPSEPVLAHRDLHDGQFLELTGALGWIDFDLACRADSALDAANLSAHFELRRMQKLWDGARDDEDALRSALLAGLGRSEAPGFAERFRFYSATARLRLALVYALRPRWASLAGPLVAAASRELEPLLGTGAPR